MTFYAHYTLTLKLHHFGPQTSAPTQPKTTLFWALELYLYIYIFKKKKQKKKRRKIRVAGVIPAVGLGVVELPHGQGDGLATLKRPKKKYQL